MRAHCTGCQWTAGAHADHPHVAETLHKYKPGSVAAAVADARKAFKCSCMQAQVGAACRGNAPAMRGFGWWSMGVGAKVFSLLCGSRSTSAEEMTEASLKFIHAQAVPSRNLRDALTSCSYRSRLAAAALCGQRKALKPAGCRT